MSLKPITPLGVGGKVEATQTVHNMYHAVTTAAAKNSPYVGVGEGRFKVAETFVGGTTVNSAYAKRMGHHLRLPSLVV